MRRRALPRKIAECAVEKNNKPKESASGRESVLATVIFANNRQ
jgi:hypothetical protein